MKTINTVIFVVMAFFTSASFAQLEVFEDYDIGEKVYSMTTIKVDPNMMDYYLEGLRGSWVTGNEVSKDLGQIEDYAIYLSDLTESGDFNLVLVVTFAKGADAEPNKAEYEKWLKAFGKKMLEKTREISKTYPGMREITGEYRLREITLN